MADNKLIGQNYTTPDLVAKVTGKAKYAEDYRAEGMLFAKLLLSPMPHARVKRLDTSAALAMPGVKAILTADDLPGAAASAPTLGEGVQATAQGERGADQRAALSGRADSRRRRRRRAHRRRSDRSDRDRVRAAAVRRRSDREPAARRPERARRRATSGARAEAAGAAGASRRAPPAIEELKWTDGRLRRRRARARCRWARRPTSGRTATSRPASRARRSSSTRRSSTPNTSHQPLETRTAMAYWQNGKLYMHCSTQSTVQTVGVGRALGRHRADQGRHHQRVHRRRLRQQDSGRDLDGDPGAALEEGRTRR